MTRLHLLTVAAGLKGLSVALECPYDGVELTGMPDFMLPDCRPGRAEQCAGRAALAAHGIAGCWKGPTVTLAEVTYVNLWRDGGGLHMAAVTEDAAPIEDVAAWLADASGTGRGPTLLLDERCGLSNIEYCYKAADKRRVVPAEQLARWRSQLLNWHEAQKCATPTRPAGTRQPL